MRYKGRIFAVGVVALFNVLRYFYYHVYFGIPFKLNFFNLTFIFMVVAWWCGKQFDRAKFYSEKDPLTNTYNRRTLEKIFRKLIVSCHKENRKLGVIMIDLDNFKEVNDTFGHEKGDELLTVVANLLEEVVGKDNFVARWGGDEFVVLTPYMNDSETYIQELQKEQGERNLLNETSVGMSVGYSVYPDDGKTLEILLRKADQAMYKRKKEKLEA